ncbi:MAG: cytidylate kinase-like family protein [Candidatus Zixiibacteriota bacterium]|nr:MAG: cytidylate kinase-like family protein [candidate division Zixibacteria bacterium]
MAIITLTRGSLSATYKLAEMLCKQNPDCRTVAREEIIKYAEKYGMEETGMADTGYMEVKPPQFWDRQAAQRRLYLIYFKASLMDFIIKDNIVYHGHLAQFQLSDVPKILRVRVDASLDYRVQALMSESNYTQAEAQKHIFEIDSRRKDWAKFLYNVDFNDTLNYDIVLNMDKMSVETMADVIFRTARSPEYTIDDEARKVIRDVHLKSVILANLARSPRTRGMELMIQCDSDSGIVKARGLGPILGTETWENDIREVISSIDGVKEVDVCC